MSRRKPSPPVVGSRAGQGAGSLPREAEPEEKPGPVRVPRVISSKVTSSKVPSSKVPSSKASMIDAVADPWLPVDSEDYADSKDYANSEDTANWEENTGSVVAFPRPRRKRRRLYLILTLVASVLLMGGLLAYLIFSPALALRSVEVSGNTLVTTEEATAALEPLLGKPLPQITDEEVRTLLNGFAPIESVTVAAVPPSGLAVTISERVPVAILESSGEFLLIDAEGRQLASVQDREAVQLPLIDGGTNAVNSEVFSSIAAVLAALPQSVLNQLNHASAKSVDSVELLLANNQRIFWGSAEENSAKALVLEALLAAPPADPPATVFDVSTPSRPVTR